MPERTPESISTRASQLPPQTAGSASIGAGNIERKHQHMDAGFMGAPREIEADRMCAAAAR